MSPSEDDIKTLQLGAVAEGVEVVAAYAEAAFDFAVDRDEAAPDRAAQHGCRCEPHARLLARNAATVQLGRTVSANGGRMTYFASIASDRAASHEACTPKPKPVAPRSSYTAPELQLAEFPPIKFVVPGYFVEGLTLFAGKPKFGKSWLVIRGNRGGARRLHPRGSPLHRR